MRRIIGGNAVKGQAASTGQIGRSETGLPATDETLAALCGLSGA